MMSKIFNGFCFLFSILLIGSISLYLGQDVNYDLLNYHYYNAYAFLHYRLKQDFMAAGINSYLNPLFDVVNYLVIKYFSPKFVSLILGSIQGINLYLLILISRQFISQYSTSIILALLGFYSANVIGEIGTTFNDLNISIFILLSIFLITIALKHNITSKKKLIYFFVGSFSIGVAIGLKLTFCIYLIGIFIPLILLKNEIMGLSKLKVIMLFAIGALLGVLLTEGFWAYTLWKQFGNPLFPFYNKFFKSVYFPLINLQDTRFLAHGFMHKIFYPFYFSSNHATAEVKFQDFRLPIVYTLLFIYAFKILPWKITDLNITQNRVSASFKWLILFYITSYIVWQYQFSIQRYAIVLDMLAPLLIYLLIIRIIKHHIFRNIVLLVVFVFLVILMQPLEWGRLPLSKNFFEVKFPQRWNKEENVIVLQLEQTTSFIIPFYPRQWHVVGVDGNYILKETIKDYIHNDKKKYKFLGVFRENPNSAIINIPQKYGFQSFKTCEKIKTKVCGLIICELEPNFNK